LTRGTHIALVSWERRVLMGEEEKEAKQTEKEAKKTEKEAKKQAEKEAKQAAKEAKKAAKEATPRVRKKIGVKIVVLVAFLLIVMALGGAYFMFGEEFLAEYAAKSIEANEEKKEGVGPILALEPFVFNVSGSSGKYAKVSLGIQLKDAKAGEEAKKMVPAIRDKMLLVLGSKTAEALADVKTRETVKRQLKNALREVFKDGNALVSVYITDIIIQ
jgi:flagellar FliL protein